MMSLRTGTHQSAPPPQRLPNTIMRSTRIMGLGFSRWSLWPGDAERSTTAATNTWPACWRRWGVSWGAGSASNGARGKALFPPEPPDGQTAAAAARSPSPHHRLLHPPGRFPQKPARASATAPMSSPLPPTWRANCSSSSTSCAASPTPRAPTPSSRSVNPSLGW
jgi:hypothetical protein